MGLAKKTDTQDNLKEKLEEGRARELQKKAEAFFYKNILLELKEQFQQFMDDHLLAELLDERTKGHIDDLIRSIGKVKIDKLHAIKSYCDNENLFAKIVDCLGDVPRRDRLRAMLTSDDMNRRYLIPLTLRPPRSEEVYQRHPQLDPVATGVIMEVLSRWLGFAREKDKALSALIDTLSNIQESEFEQYTALPVTIWEMKEHVDSYKKLTAILEDAVNKIMARPQAKSTLKPYFWEKIIIQSIELLNDFCHDDSCDEKNCQTIHDLAIDKTAKLLTMIYPEEFGQDIDKTVNRIKRRYLDIRYARTEKESFIRGLYSRYQEDMDHSGLTEQLSFADAEENHTRDSLTGLHTKEFLLDAGTTLHATALRNKFNLAVYVVDIDGIKLIKENYGKDAGNVIIKKQSDALMSLFKRQSDIVAYIGEERFCVVTPYESEDKLRDFSEQLRRHLEKQVTKHKGTKMSCHVSIGICLQQLGTLEKMIKHADAMVRRAKQNGGTVHLS